MIEAYPLCWPIGQARNKNPESSRFRTTFAKARDSLLAELKRFNAEDIILSTNIPLKKDGNPYSSYRLEDNGVAIYFSLKNKSMVFACDKWISVTENIQSLKRTIECLRAIKRYGTSELMERAFSGFAQLAQNLESKSWYEVLNIPKNCRDMVTVKQSRNFLIKKYHEAGSEPDDFIMREINSAFDRAKDILEDYYSERKFSENR